MLNPYSKKKHLVASYFGKEIPYEMGSTFGSPGESLQVHDRVGVEKRLVQRGRAYLFDGVNDFISMIGVANFNSANIIEAEMFFSTTGVVDQTMFGGLPGIKFLVSLNPAGRVTLYSATSSAALLLHTTTLAYNDGAFYKLNFLINYTTKDWRLSINDVILATGNAPTIANSFSMTTIEIGRNNVAQYFNRRLHSFKVLLDNVLFCQYKMDEGGGTLAYDSSGNGNHGTITNATLATFHTTQTDGNGADWQNQVGYTPAMRFDGLNAELTIASNDTLTNINGEFAIEVTINTTDRSVEGGGNRIILNMGAFAAANISMLIDSTNGRIQFYTNTQQAISTTAIDNGVDHHIAFTRNNVGLIRIFIDGTQEASFTDTRTYNSDALIYVGGRSSLSGNYNGIIKFLRITKGAALYTANFTAPTQYSHYTVTTNTSLFLLHGNWDESGYRNTITENGNQNINIPRNEANITQDALGSPLFFRDRVKYNAKLVNSHALMFDGVNDRITFPNRDAGNLSGQSSFEVDVFFMINNTETTAGEILGEHNSGVAQNWRISYGVPAGGLVTLTAVVIGNLANLVYTVPGIQLGQWNRVTISRTGGIFRYFINGIIVVTDSTNIGTIVNNVLSFTIGATGNSTAFADMRLSKVTIVSGAAVHTNNFNYLDFSGYNIAQTISDFTFREGAGGIVFDESGNQRHGRMVNFVPANAWTTQSISHRNLLQGFDSVQVFDRTLQRNLTVPNSADFQFLADWSVDVWVCPTEDATSEIFASRTNVLFSDASFTLVRNSGSGALWVLSSTDGASWSVNMSGGVIALYQWTHIAYSRQGNVFRAFVNGALVLTTTVAGSFASPKDIRLGGTQTGGTDFRFVGYTANARIFQGRAVYTGAFTPPQTAVDYSDTTNQVLFIRDLQDVSPTLKTITNNGVVLAKTRIVAGANAVAPYHKGHWNRPETVIQYPEAPELIRLGKVGTRTENDNTGVTDLLPHRKIELITNLPM